MANPYDDFLKEAGSLLELDWRKYRRRASRRNLHVRMEELGVTDYDDYLGLLRNDAQEADRLPDLLRVTVSRFFREQSCWMELADRVLPELAGGAGGTLRAWSCGCCNGEEAYSLAMLALWRFPPEGALPLPMDILATDIDEHVIARAEAGCYEAATLRELPRDMPPRFLEQRGHRFCVRDAIRELVRYRRHDLMRDEPFAGMDLVLCRYLPFTYYLGARRREAAVRLWRSLRPGGALMIGRKENPGPGETDLFEPWPGTDAVLRKRINTG